MVNGRSRKRLYDPEMTLNFRDVLAIPDVIRALRLAWDDSNPGIVGGHEEGGFICVNANGDFVIDRWPRGDKDLICVPPHPQGKRNGETIIATFHTHPNIGNTYDQEPSPGDRRMVRQDADLKHSEYIGEFVISQQVLYLVLPNGNVMDVGSIAELFTGGDE
jgi:Domain of unknown function (DUF4329)